MQRPAGLIPALVDVRRHAPPLQLVAKLHAQKGAGRVAGDAFIKTGRVFYHFHVFIDQVRRDIEIVVVGDRMDLFVLKGQCVIHDLAHPLNILAAFDVIIFQVDEKGVVGGVIGKAFFEGDGQQILLDAHATETENPLVHKLGRLTHDGFEIHQGQDLGLQVDPGSDLDQFQAFVTQGKDAALGDVQHPLPVCGGIRAAEGFLFHLPDKFLLPAFVIDAQPPLVHEKVQVAGGEHPQETDRLGILADVDETARPGKARPKTAHVDVALGVGFSHAQKGDVEPAAVVEIELIVLRDQGVDVDARAEIQPAHGKPADDARLRRQGAVFQNPLFIGHPRDPFGHADAQVDDAVGLEFEGGAPGDDLAAVQGQRRHPLHGHPVFATESRAVGLTKGLPMVFGLGHDHAIHQNAGDDHLTGIERSPVGQPFDLYDHHSAGVAGGLGHAQGVEDHGLLFHGDIAVRIRRGAAQESHMDGKGFIEEVILPVDGHQLNEIFAGGFGELVELAPVLPRIDKRAEAHMGQVARLAGGDIAIELGHGTHGHVVGQDLVLIDQAAQSRRESRMPADDSSHQAFEGKMVQALGLAVPLPRRIGQGQVPRPTGFQEPLLEGDGQFLGEPGADESGGHNGVIIPDQLDGLLGTDDFSFLHPHGRNGVDHGVMDIDEMLLADQGMGLFGNVKPFSGWVGC
ncbi:conserved hypothetical protein [Desulfosarcina cetonica]|nr:conserved hypothetical protein [Desulfosarcina cetonica]